MTDHLGSVRDLINSSGAVVNHIDYNAFGSVVAETNPSNGDRYKFTGRELDTETGLYYYRARYYDPIIGRFISSDPIRFAGGSLNLYSYVGNSPTNRRDPSGLMAAIEEAEISGQKDPAIAKGAQCTGRKSASLLLELTMGLVLAVKGQGLGFAKRPTIPTPMGGVCATSKFDPPSGTPPITG